ncbi:MAG TPA: M14 family zinc carboxypeptidase [Gemmatimonadales bacterium]|nr:M14 family zinc carboxypeptidase [Gemmatimonadales bacterium]
MARRSPGLLVLAALAAIAPRAAAQQLRLAEVRVGGRAGLDSLARAGFEVADLRREAGGLYAVIVVSTATEPALLRSGYRAAPVPGAPPGVPAVGDTFRVFRSFDKPVTGIRATLGAWAAADTIFHLDSLGATLEGRPILAVKIGDGADSPSRPNVLVMATHHAREWISTEVAMKLIRWIADSLSRPLLAQRDIWVIPVENPDGYQFTFDSVRLWRKNRRPNLDGSFGVDPNRNYPMFWGYDNLGSSGVTSSETYRGQSAGSERETQAIVAFHAAHPPVVSISYHSYSGLVLYPYGFKDGELTADDPVFRALAGNDLAPAVRDSLPNSTLAYYHPGPSWNLYPTNGEYTEWAYRAHGTLAFTPEMTSGCCDSTGAYYGFVFPDDSAAVERVFRDNLPFALAVIQAAGNPVGATGPSGLTVDPPRFLSLWPEARLETAASAATSLALTVGTKSGGVLARTGTSDSLSRGRYRTLYRSDLSADAVRVVQEAGISGELLSLGGAEAGDAGWTGFQVTTDALAGAGSWLATHPDTLTSPPLDLSARSRVWLQFWTKHQGSTFTPQYRGRVQFSRDSGATWNDVAAIVGDGQAWYPVRVDLPQATGARGARVRFIAESSFVWQLDAVGLASDSAAPLAPATAASDLEVSDNPARGSQVVLSWPAGSGTAVIAVYTFLGDRVFVTSQPASAGQYVWDLSSGGRPVGNGAYLVVVRIGATILQRKLFVARP